MATQENEPAPIVPYTHPDLEKSKKDIVPAVVRGMMNRFGNGQSSGASSDIQAKTLAPIIDTISHFLGNKGKEKHTRGFWSKGSFQSIHTDLGAAGMTRTSWSLEAGTREGLTIPEKIGIGTLLVAAAIAWETNAFGIQDIVKSPNLDIKEISEPGSPPKTSTDADVQEKGISRDSLKGIMQAGIQKEMCIFQNTGDDITLQKDLTPAAQEEIHIQEDIIHEGAIFMAGCDLQNYITEANHILKQKVQQ